MIVLYYVDELGLLFNGHVIQLEKEQNNMQ